MAFWKKWQEFTRLLWPLARGGGCFHFGGKPRASQQLGTHTPPEAQKQFVPPTADSFRHMDQSQEQAQVPEHLAIILDGNGRWAKQRGLPRSAGHRQGAKNLKRIVAAAARSGIKYLTVYAFSTENWRRPKEEVEALMSLFLDFFRSYDAELAANDVRLRFLGELEQLPPKVFQTIQQAQNHSENRQGMQLLIAYNYGGRREILRACQLLTKEYLQQQQQEQQSPLPSENQAEPMAEATAAPNPLTLSPEHWKEEDLVRHLYLPDVPDPDLLIRTAGELRLSNFLLWQLAYAEFYVTAKLWPDFDEKDLQQAIAAFQQRERRYGGLKS